MSKSQFGPSNIMFPTPAALIVSGTFEKANIATIAWITNLSGQPPILGMAMGKKKYSLELIRQYKEFSVNIPSSGYVKETDFCGITSGRNVDKFQKTGFTKLESSKISSPIIKECPLNLECKWHSEVDFGNTVLVVGNILETHFDADKLKEGDIPAEQFDVAKAEPFAYFNRLKQYRRIGDLLDTAYESGKDLF